MGRQLTDRTLTDRTTHRLRQLTDRANWRQLTDYDNLPTTINLYINGQLTDYKLTDSYKDIRHFLPEAVLACQDSFCMRGHLCATIKKRARLQS